MKHIYFVHDSQEDPTIRRHYLESSGFRVTTFKNGEDAVSGMLVDCPDAVVMDILLEGKNGFEVCRDIRKLYPKADLPVILCSAVYRQRTFREEAADAGAQGYLLRPFPLGELVQQLNRALTRSAGSVTGPSGRES